MIITMPKKTYKCKKCGGMGREYKEPPASEFAGHYYGVECIECGHKTRHYQKSIYELETGSGNAYSYNPNEAIEF